MDTRRGKGRKYGFACLACRRRKIKCDGRKPTCVNCARCKKTCTYQGNPAFVAHLGDELRKHQTRVQELENWIRELAGADAATRDRRLAEIVPQLDRLDGDEDHSTLSPDSPIVAIGAAEKQNGDDISYDGGAQFSIDQDGRQHYFGATSRFHALSDDGESETNRESNVAEAREMENYHRKWLISNARFQPSWERMAYANMHCYTDIDPSIGASLLEVYWAWQGPLHNYVYRRCFFRDMALGGPYFSPFLLNVIFAHACRHMPEDDVRFAPFKRGETFLEQAMLLLIEEVKESKPRIPTIQGLLILGGRQCAVGKSSQGWLYTGMAIRMMTDLGLHLGKSKTTLMKDYEPDDLEIRKRLCLSVYAWDKSISLCLGRPPSLKDIPHRASALFDLSDDADLWHPPRLLETDKTYPPTKCHSTLTFKSFCHLAEIINESYDTVYSGTTRNINPSAIFRLEEKLRSFHEQLPDFLRIDNPAGQQPCVPPHILCLNILSHTMLILIYRPFFIWRWHAKLRQHPLALRAQAVCTKQAADINEIFRVYGRLFNFHYQSYLISYCVYTAATIDVRLVRHDDRTVAESAADRLAVTLQMLETEIKQTPGIRRSIEIIRSHLGNQGCPDPRPQEAEAQSPSPPEKEQWSGERPDPGEKTMHRTQGPDLYTWSGATVVSEQLELPLIDDLSPFIDPNIELQSAGMDWSVDDSGGGFVPDMAHWSDLGSL